MLMVGTPHSHHGDAGSMGFGCWASAKQASEQDSQSEKATDIAGCRHKLPIGRAEE